MLDFFVDDNNDNTLYFIENACKNVTDLEAGGLQCVYLSPSCKLD